MADQRPIGYWLKLVDRLIDERFDETLDEHGVTRRQWQLLNLLGRGPASQQELDDAVAPFVDRTTGTATSTVGELDELVDSDWVARTPSGFALTDRGQLSFTRIAEVVGRIRDEISAGVEEADYLTTTRTLEAMARNLGWSGS